MEQITQTTTPIIPVIDERLPCLPETPSEHKAKIDQYNDLLEDVYQREVELSRYKSALTNMREEIAKEAVLLASTGALPPIASAASEGSDSDENEAGSLSDSSGGTGAQRNSIAGVRPKTGSKKAKRRFTRHSKVPNVELDAQWDYNYGPALGSAKKGRRGSTSIQEMQV